LFKKRDSSLGSLIASMITGILKESVSDVVRDVIVSVRKTIVRVSTSLVAMLAGLVLIIVGAVKYATQYYDPVVVYTTSGIVLLIAGALFLKKRQ